jgi:cullin 3
MWVIGNLVPEVLALAQDDVSSSSSEQLSKRASKLLKYISDQWKHNTLSAAMIDDIMMFLNRAYAEEMRKPPVFELVDAGFRDNLLYYPIGSPKSDARVIDILFDVMFNLISLSRNGQSVDKKLLRSCVGLLKGLYGAGGRTEDNDLYNIDFEPRFIANSKDFFVKEAKSLVQQSASIWLQRTNYWLKEETELCRTVIWGPTHHAMIKIVESQLIHEHLEHHATNLRAEIDMMFRDEDFQNLQLLHEHIHRVDFRLQFLKKVFHSFIVDCATDINDILDASINLSQTSWLADDIHGRNRKFEAVSAQNYLLGESHGLSWALDILELERKATRNWERGLDRDPILRIVQSRSFSDFFESHSQAPRYLSLFLDFKIRSCVGSTSSIHFEDLMDAVGLVQYILPVAAFQYWYKEHLGQRLVSYHSVPSFEIERMIISRLRVEIGDGYSDELERMLEDGIFSQTVSQGFAESIKLDEETAQKNVVLSVSILTNSFWPDCMVRWRGYDASGGNQEALLCPSELAELKEKFEGFHMKRTNRRLVWHRLAGIAEIDCSFPEFRDDNGHHIAARQYRFEVPTCFMIVMLLFNELDVGESLSVNDIQEKSKLPTWVLSKTLAVLSEIPETQILSTTLHTTVDESRDEYFFNDSFTSKTKVVTIPATLISSVCGKENEIRKYNERQSRFDTEGLEACIIRIMK